MEIDELRREVKKVLISQREKNEDSTIPALCQKLNVKDEFDMITVIGDLEVLGDAELVGFKPVYREDGGAIYLARYTGKANN